MRGLAKASELLFRRRARVALGAIVLFAAAAGPAYSADCSFEPQGEGRVAAIIDPRSFRLQDGREVRLAGIEPITSEKPLPGKSLANDTPALAAILSNREVKLRGQDDTPDRYGRQSAYVFLIPSETLVQGELLAQGEASVSATVTEGMCRGPDGRRGGGA